MKFLDQAKVFVKSGDGGAGCISFRREKFVELGGPNGGNGGRGGDVCIMSVHNINTLIDFRYRQHFKAARGEHGMGRSRSGADGQSVILRVPVGTQIWDEHKELLLADFSKVDQNIVLLRGGRGGLGNEHFKSSTNRSPRYAQPGEVGEEYWIWLHLKLIADVGLVGLPNAGKSTFLSVVSHAKPKIADYPFTTLYPQLGVVRLDDEREFVVADLPGLIEGASLGRGLGDRFLGHTERCNVLIHLVDGSAENVAEAYQTVRHEITLYGNGLDQKPELVVLSKSDILGEEEADQKMRELQIASGQRPLLLSAVSNEGVRSLLEKAWGTIFATAQNHSLEDRLGELQHP